MKKSLRLLFATLFMATAIAAATNTSSNTMLGEGVSKPDCPPGGCAVK